MPPAASARLPRSRIAAGAAAVLLQLLIGYALLSGLRVSTVVQAVSALKVFDVAVPPPPPPKAPVVPRPQQHRRAGRAAPPALRAKAAPIVVPQPIIPPLVVPPLIAAIDLGPGADNHAGAAPVAGPGTGAGGSGNGRGSGGEGDGDGDGGVRTPSRQIAGRITDNDYPRGIASAGISGTVRIEFMVTPQGYVRDCAVVASSGSADLDALTCRLVTNRYRYKPARDAQGRKVPDYWVNDHHWILTRRVLPPEPDDAPNPSPGETDAAKGDKRPRVP